jgi:hypothetical protein
MFLKPKTDEAPKPPSQADQWATMFRIPRTTACSKEALLRQIRAEVLEEREARLGRNGRKGAKKFFWVKQWGYGPSAYLFDFLDPVIRGLVTREMSEMITALKNFSQTDPTYADPLDFKKMISKDSTSLSKRLLKKMKLFTKNYDPKVYDRSVNAVQIKKALPEWKWNVDTSNSNFPVKFLDRFDLNFDGRLNPREIVLGAIMNNRGVMGTQLCKYCFNNSTKVMDSVFLYLDCNDDGWLSAEEFWHNLRNLERNTQKYNLFSFGVEESIRTAAVNDFIIKNGKTKEGYVTKEEFRQGLLLGLWDRQTEKTQVLFDDSRTMKTLRWRDDDTIDVSLYNFYKKKMAAKMK